MVCRREFRACIGKCVWLTIFLDMLPVIMAAVECPTHTIVDAAMRSLPVVLPVLDFSTIKNELFPVIAMVFSRTNSLAIKVRGLQAFVILCGGSTDAANDDGLNGLATENKKTSSSSALDKYTMQEKIIPLVRAIKTKEPAVMIAALNVLRIVGQVADADFVAMEILPILWNMSLGPLLNLKQFQSFMDLIKSLSRRVEDEQTRKLQELSGTNGTTAAPNEDFMAFGGVTGTTFDQTGATPDDFEALVKGRAVASPTPSGGATMPSWDEAPSAATSSINRSGASTPKTAAFSWSTPSPPQKNPPSQVSTVKAQQSSFRTVTPDLARFETMTPTSTQFSQPMQPTQSAFSPPPVIQQPQQQQPQAVSSGSGINWATAAATNAASNPWGSTSTTSNYTANTTSSGSGFGSMNTSSMSNLSLNSRPALGSTSSNSSFTIPPPPGATTTTSSSGFAIPPPPSQTQQANPWASTTSQSPMGMAGMGGSMMGGTQPSGGGSGSGGQQKSGLDKYESLI